MLHFGISNASCGNIVLFLFVFMTSTIKKLQFNEEDTYLLN